MSNPSPQPYIFDFVKMLHQFQAIQRDIDVPEDRGENDVEHSYQLTMICWYLIDRNKLPLDMPRVLMYALAHDLVEVHAGDVNPLTADSHTMAQKPKVEQQAADRLQRDFPEVPTLHEVIHMYEKKTDAESRFVYVVDKVLPIMNVYLHGGSWYKEHGITEKAWMAHTLDKLGRANYVPADDGGFIQELLGFIQEETARLFAGGESTTS